MFYVHFDYFVLYDLQVLDKDNHDLGLLIVHTDNYLYQYHHLIQVDDYVMIILLLMYYYLYNELIYGNLINHYNIENVLFGMIVHLIDVDLVVLLVNLWPVIFLNFYFYFYFSKIFYYLFNYLKTYHKHTVITNIRV